MNIPKRALHLAVTVGLVGGAVGVAAAPAAHAVAVPPDACAAFIQGTVDPTGGLLPGGILPFGPQSFAMTGHETKGQDKVFHDLDNGGAGLTRLKLGVAITNNQPPLVGTSNLKIGWKNGLLGEPVMPNLKIDVPALKAKAIWTAAPDNTGAQLGQEDPIVSVGPPEVVGDPSYRLVIPKGGANGDTFTFGMTIPRNSSVAATIFVPGSGVPPVEVNIPFPGIALSSTPAVMLATIDGTVQAVMNGVFGAGAFTVNTSQIAAFSAGAANGDYRIQFTGPGVALGGPPLLFIHGDDSPPAQTGALHNAVVSDGSAWNGLRSGGIDPGTGSIGSLGHGIFSMNGVYSSTGKAQNAPDRQATFVNYPPSIVLTANPAFEASAAVGGTLAFLAGLTGLPVVQNACSLGGLLAVFCAAEPAIVPAAFSGFCAGVLTNSP